MADADLRTIFDHHHGDYRVRQWLAGSTAKAYRPTLDEVERAGMVVLHADDLATMLDLCARGVESTHPDAVDSDQALRLIQRCLRTLLPPKA